MSQQNDFIAGLDISSLASVTQAQLLQMINQCAPLSNIGCVLCFDGISTGAAGTGFPDVTNNARFVRYIWLDTNPGGDAVAIDRSAPVFKRYVGAYTGGPSNPSALSNLYTDWQTLGVAPQSVTTAMMRLRDATGGVNLALLKLNSDQSATIAKAYYVLVVDSAGVNIEAVSFATAMGNGGGVPLVSISAIGLAAGKYLGYSAGTLAYRNLDPTVDFTALLANQIPATTAILPGTAKYVLRTNTLGTACEWIATNDAAFFAAGAITLDKLASGGAANNDYLRYNGAAWVKQTPAHDIATGIISADGVAIVVNTVQTFVVTARPKYLRAVIFKFQGVAEGNFVVSDEIDLTSVFADPGGTVSTGFSIKSDGLAVYTQFFNTPMAALNKTSAVAQSLTLANWKPRIYYWL